MSLPIIKIITNRDHFGELLKSNPGLFILKFGAEWCGPCKTIDEGIEWYFERMPENIQTAIIDIDKCSDVYSFLKSKRVINGVPVLLCYNKGNLSHIPDDIVIGADKNKINEFFVRCNKLLG
jgi:thiol-disulfide isomerase/thioredoxin